MKPLPGREDVGPDRLGNENCTALSPTVDNEHEGVVKRLLSWESVAPNCPGESYRTPPHCAVEEHEVAIKPPPTPASVDSNGLEENDRMPFQCAVGEPNESVILSMPEQGNVAPRLPDVNDRTRGCDRCVLL